MKVISYIKYTLFLFKSFAKIQIPVLSSFFSHWKADFKLYDWIFTVGVLKESVDEGKSDGKTAGNTEENIKYKKTHFFCLSPFPNSCYSFYPVSAPILDVFSFNSNRLIFMKI